MYQYNETDQRIVSERVAEFRDQVQRRLQGTLSEAEFRPLRLMNGLYLQRHAYMLRVAIPYGLLSSAQLRTLAHIARTWDKGYGHFTTRQNIQFNWPKLKDVPDILDALAKVEMHAIQTSGNCVRNVTADHFSGSAQDEIEDPRPWCEILRQFSTFHPEFTYLPRKFKIAICGRTGGDGAAITAHDIGLRIVRDEQGTLGFKVLVGGGLGRTPILGKVVRDFLPAQHIRTYVESILRVYNLHGNRSNKYKARIKILVRSLGVDTFRAQVEEEFARMKDGPTVLTDEDVQHFRAFFAPPAFSQSALQDGAQVLQEALDTNPAFARWYRNNTHDHKAPGYRIVSVSVKAPDIPPGDVTDEQLDVLADVAEKLSFDQLTITHEQNAILPHVEHRDLPALFDTLHKHNLATPNIGTLTDMICCPGLDFCSLANAGSISVAKQINDAFDDFDYLYDLGDIKLKMSGCINACGHHHVGHIGILGINKKGEEWYQIMLGGSADDNSSLGRWIGPALPHADVSKSLKRILDVYLQEREEGEQFLETYRRIGVKPFSEKVYEDHPSKRRTRRSVDA